MKTIGTILGNILGITLALGLTAALGYFGYFVARRYAVLFARLDFTVAMVTATAAAVVLLTGIIIARSIRHASIQSREVQLRADKAEAYKLFISLWEEMLRPGQSEQSSAHSRMMQDVNHLLLLHGSPALIKAHAAMPGLSLAAAQAQFAEALLAIRKDLGMESQGLEGKEMAQLVLEGLENPRATSRQSAHQDTQPRVSLAPN